MIYINLYLLIHIYKILSKYYTSLMNLDEGEYNSYFEMVNIFSMS